MSGSLLAACALYALFVAAWALTRAVRGRPADGLPGLAARALAALQFLQALVAAAVLTLGTRTVESPVTVAGYLVASCAVLPAAFAFGEDEDGWDAAILALAGIALAVADWRLTLLWEQV